VADSHAIPARREFKYLVDRALLPELREALRPWFDRDKHAGPDGAYGLRSLYFDAPDLRLFQANESEVPVRFKARIRSYPEATRSRAFAEIKARDGDIIRKTRTLLPEHDWRAGLEAGGGVPLGPFVSRMHRHNLSPVVLVDYRREAWMSRIDEYARVSIDTEIRCQGVRSLTLEGDPRRWRPIDHTLLTFTPFSACVVELKFADYAPYWMMQLTQQLDLLRHAFSKYCYSMLSLADDHFRDYREAQSAWG